MIYQSRRSFLKTTAIGTAGLTLGGLALSSKSYANTKGANDKVRVGIVGFSDRAKNTLIPCFLEHCKELNMEIVAVSDIWNKRRDEAQQFFSKLGLKVEIARNNEELYTKYKLDAVIVGTADFQHALHAIEAVKAGCDAYVEKPFAETMEDNRNALKVIKASDRVISIGSQRRSGANYLAANDYIRSGKFGKINMVEMTWNVNQPGRWRRPELVADLKESDVDWKRFLMNSPYVEFDPRKYIEYRLFWPYSSGIPGQWMCHQIDTVHWFTGYNYPLSVVANGGIYMWDDGRSNQDTLSAVFEYGDKTNKKERFQVLYSSRQHNSAGGIKELYYSNGGTLNLETNKVTPEGGLTANMAKAMKKEPFLLDEFSLVSEQMKVATESNTSTDQMASAHMRNWMECIRSRKQTNAPVEAGYNHSIAVIMTNAAVITKQVVTFDEATQEVMAGGKPFIY